MTLGEIKIQTLELLEINVSDISTEILEELYSDENYKEYFSRMPSSVTRAIQRMKTVGVIPSKSCEGEETEVSSIISKYDTTSLSDDFSRLRRVAIRGNDLYIEDYPFLFEGANIIILRDMQAGWTPVFIYEPKMPVYTILSDDKSEIPLPDELAAIIPYFVKADIFEQDEPELATQARNIFELMLAEYKKQDDNISISICSEYRQG